jgi:hypothetical protein
MVWSRSAILALFLALVLSLGIATRSFAGCTNDADAAQNASAFLSNPASLLNGPNGPRSAAEITNDVRDFVAANPRALAPVIALLKGTDANVDQQKAIGAGLGLAAGVCLRPDPTFAGEIQTELAGTDSVSAKAQYAAVTGNNPLGSIGGFGASSGAVGGQTNPLGTTTGSSSFQAFTSNSVSNIPKDYFTGGVTGAGGSSTSTTSNFTTNNTCTVSSTC